MGSPSKPNAADPPRRSDLVSWYVPYAVDDGDWHPTTESRLIAHKAAHAERHAHAADECLVHSPAGLTFRHATSAGRPSGRASGPTSAVRNFVMGRVNLNTSPIYQTGPVGPDRAIFSICIWPWLC